MNNSRKAARPAAERLTYNIDEAAEKLGISARHGYELARRDEFPVRVIRAGHRMLVPKAELDALLAGVVSYRTTGWARSGPGRG